MTNRYKGYCDKCRKVVKPGEGTAIKRQGAWFVRHGKCNEVQGVIDRIEMEQRAYIARHKEEYVEVDRYPAQRSLPFER